MSLTIELVDTFRQRKEFLGVPLSIYGPRSAWVRPLDQIVLEAVSNRNPFYQNGSGQAFLVKDSGKPVGRILAHWSRRHRHLHEEKAGYFGFFECINDPKVAQLLFDSAECFLKAERCGLVRGPFNLTAAQEIGIMVRGFEHVPAIDMVYTAEWYPSLLEALGYRRSYRMHTWRNDRVRELVRDPDQHKARMNAHGITIRPIRSGKRKEELEYIREIVNSAFLGNWNFVPITREEWNLQTGALVYVLDPEILMIAEKDQVPIGVSFVVPDYNQVFKLTRGKLIHPRAFPLLGPGSIHSAVVILFAVRKEYQGLGVCRALNAHMVEALKRRGYENLSITWIGEQNKASLRQAEFLGMEPLHELAMYEKELS